MLHSRKINNSIYRLHERCSCIIYKNNISTFDELLELDNSVSIHQRNLQCLDTDLHMIFNGISPDIMKDIFQLKTTFFYDRQNFIPDL